MGTMRCMHGHSKVCVWAHRGACMSTVRCMYGHSKVCVWVHSEVYA